MKRVPVRRHPVPEPSRRRSAPRLLALTATVAVILTGCTSAGSAEGAVKARTEITVTPAAGSKPVPVDRSVTVRASGDGKLTSVQVSAPGPGKLDGKISGSKDAWVSTAPLAPGVTYQVLVHAAVADGKKDIERSSFTTADPDPEKTFVGEYNVDKGSTVGVGMPVSLVFNRPIHDKAAVERRLKVSASPAVDGAWSWMKNRDGKDRIDYRPKKFWKPGTEVSLRMSLDGVDAGDGLHGTQNRLVKFRIGKSVVSTVDVVKKTMKVSEGGKVRTLPISAGKKKYETWNGTMVVLSKVPTIRMNSRSVGIFGPEAYDLGAVKWDVQLTPSGTYAHAAPWNDGKFGKVNGSHGCIGMSTKDAKWFYDRVHEGDPVTVVNSKDTVSANNGYGGWNVDWDAWKAGSALK